MNDFGQLQLIWIRRLARETSRIETLMEVGNLSVIDLVRYKKSISAIDDYCRFVIDAQDWDNVGKIPEIIEDVEEKLFIHFFDLIDHFDGEEVHLDFSNEDDGVISLNFDDISLEDITLTIIDDDDIDIFL